MNLPKNSLRPQMILLLAGMLLVPTAGCESLHQESVREIGAATIELSIAHEPEDLARPAVEFGHKEHTEALREEGCEKCHPKKKDKFVFKFARKDDNTSAKKLMELYHDRCIGCHKEQVTAGKKSGPRVCAECHQKRPEGIAAREEVVFDYSLHFRHVVAAGEEKCDSCHHQYNEKRKKLVYRKGEEDACRDCHGSVDEGKKLSYKNASHLACVNCHFEAERKGKEHGPTGCDGCHDEGRIAEHKRIELEEIPRLKRGQKDKVEIKPKGQKNPGVVFDHLGHERRTTFCTTCHHKTPKPCVECHTQKGKKEGAFFTTEIAYHKNSSERSCIGCHQQEMKQVRCAGCHDAPRSSEIPSQGTCVVCHQGKEKMIQSPSKVEPLGADASLESAWDKLPASSDDFPKTLTIGMLADKYKASKMPHRKIVLALDESIRKSGLAKTFHQQTRTVCAGCHHRSPVSQKPRPCSACHGLADENSADKPELKAAYHRQCMGCHLSMKLQQARGCNDCHEPAKKREVGQ